MSRRKSILYNRTGFTLVEVLFALGITLLIVTNVASIVRIIKVHKEIDIYSSQCEIAAKQVSQTLHCAKYISFGQSLCFVDKDDKEFEIRVDTKRLVKQPGYDIFLHDVNSVYFYLDNHKVYMQIETPNQKSTYLVGSDYYQEEMDESDNEEIEP